MSGGNILTQEELDALLNGDPNEKNGFSNGKATLGEVRSYDFMVPNKFSKELLRSLKAIHDNMSRMVSASISVFLRQDIKIYLNYLEQRTYQEYIEEASEGVLYYVVSFIDDKAIVGLDANVALLLVEKLLGGKGAKTGINRNEPTEIESKVISNLLDQIFSLQKESWGRVMPEVPRIIKQDNHPKLIHICQPNDAVLSMRFEIIIGDEIGNITYCIPFNAIENVLPQFTTEDTMDSRLKKGEKKTQEIIKNIHDAVVPLTSILGRTEITVADVLSLRQGDIIDFCISSTSPVVINVGEFKKFSGELGISNKKYAIKITQVHF
ncbi:MAG: FliM/FliN family flagellar motor switch protein [Candidatus Margulisbacteria bacterium]|nr:FliM/FliN family flagellar motor switch protein [Candidatus Margulisiibacteriota bacterium]